MRICIAVEQGKVGKRIANLGGSLFPGLVMGSGLGSDCVRVTSGGWDRIGGLPRQVGNPGSTRCAGPNPVFERFPFRLITPSELSS